MSPPFLQGHVVTKQEGANFVASCLATPIVKTVYAHLKYFVLACSPTYDTLRLLPAEPPTPLPHPLGQ